MKRILHVASHVGNIGDDASHAGTHRILNELLGPVQFSRLDIRKSYDIYTLPDRFSFDERFAEQANDHDLVVIGGGAFLDFDIAGTRTGLMMQIDDKVLDALRVPLLVTSVGCHSRHDTDRGNRGEIIRLLENLMSRDNCALQLRNDGSTATVSDLLGPAFAASVPEVLDSGFFYENDGHLYRPFEGRYIVVSTTEDQLRLRNAGSRIEREAYLKEMRGFVQRVIDETDLGVAFALHIYGDIDAVKAILDGLNFYQVSDRVVIMPYAQKRFGADQIFSAYRNSACNVGMRFHANVCSLAMGRPTIGLVAAERSAAPHRSLGLEDGFVAVNEAGFGNRLFDRMLETLQEDPAARGATADRLENARKGTMATYGSTLKALGF